MYHDQSQHVLKQKLKNLLCSQQFCALCYEIGKCYNLFNEKLKIAANWTQDNMLIQDIYSYVFNEFGDLPASEHICSECTEQLKQSYIFIKNSKSITKLMNNFIDDLKSKSNDLINLENNTEFISTNIVIVLENNGIKYLSKGAMKNEDTSPNDKLSFKCLECSKELQTFSLWKRHTTKYHKQEYKCKKCSKTFKNQQFLTAHHNVHSKVRCKICHLILTDGEIKDHLRNEHEDDVFLCNICTDPFYTLEGLGVHAKVIHAISKETLIQCKICLLHLEANGTHNCKFKCPDCFDESCVHNKYLVSYREQMLNHISKVKCPDCDYVCRKKEVLIGHVNQEHIEHPYTCDKCGQQFYSKSVLRTHIQSCHREINICTYCDIGNNNSGTLRSNETTCKSAKRECICESCPASFATSEEMQKHEKLRCEGVSFGSCNKEFLKEFKRKEHIVKVHSGLQHKNKRLKLECAICQNFFDTNGELIRHRKGHGPNVKYPCRICNTEYESLRKLRAHSRKHVGPFATCNVCGKEMRKVLLEKHLENHKLDGVVSCSTCGKSFQNIVLLKYHQKSHLSDVPCPLCNKMINPAKLRRHVRAHEVENNPSLKENRKQKPSIKCESCDYITWNNILLDCHMNRHHMKIKPYVCHICSKDFFGKNLLKKHIESHTLDKSVVCVVCGKKFANSTCLKMHLRLHTGEKNYPCDVCGEKFRSSSIMNVHKQKKHAEKENACPLCTSMFYTLGELRRHIIKVHWKDKTRKFDPRELKGLENHYHLFHDGRRIKIDENDVDFYMPC